MQSRESILPVYVDRELDGFVLDAYANQMSRVSELGSPRADEKITGFPDTTTVGSQAQLHVHKTVQLILTAYHLSVARPLASLFSKWALASLRKAASTSTIQDGEAEALLKLSDNDIRLKRSEEIRIFRALYRYETYYHLFGRNRGRHHGAFRHREINERFFCIFDPWEVDAVGCIESFVRYRNEDVFYKVNQFPRRQGHG